MTHASDPSDPARPIGQPDLVARALGALPDDANAGLTEAGLTKAGLTKGQVDAALAADPALRKAYDAIAAHLLVYDRLPPAPPAPPFARLAAALDAEAATPSAEATPPDLHVLRLQDGTRRRSAAVKQPAPRARRLRMVALAAAAILAGILLWQPSTDDAPPRIAIVPGDGIELVRTGEALPAPAHAERTVRAGDVLHCRQPAEVRLAERIRIVLDSDARLRVEGPAAVTLEAGRAWFEVEPGAFSVRTAHGSVEVLGTAFEVDVRAGDLVVGVAHGAVRARAALQRSAGEAADGASARVAIRSATIRTGERLVAGRVGPAPFAAGEWFGRPRLRVTEAAATLHGVLRLTLVMDNPSRVAVPLRGPSESRHALWLHLEDAQGLPVRELPLLESNLLTGADLLQPGLREDLAPGAKKTLTVEIPAPFGSTGTYLCRALYRPAGRPGVLSDALRVEVR